MLLGKRTNDCIQITDAVPLFHDKVFASVLESAFTMISVVYEGQHIVGLYDAPLKYKQGDAVPLSSICLNLCEQVKATLQVPDVVALSLRVPAKLDEEDSDDDKKIKEVTQSDSAQEDGLIVDSFIVSNSSNPKRAKMEAINKA